MKKILFLVTIVCAFLTSFFSCQKTNGPALEKDRLRKLLLSDTLNLYVGDHWQLPIMLLPSDYSIDSLRWKSSDTSVIIVSNTGNVVAKKVGLSIISVRNLANTISASALAIVKAFTIDTLKEDLIAYYPFNNDASDSSGHGYNGVAFDVTSTTGHLGEANTAYHFNGTTSYIKIPDSYSLRLYGTDFAINVWVKADSFNSSFSSEIIAKRYPGNDHGYTFSISGLENTATPVGSIGFGPGGTTPGATSGFVINLNKWYMLTVVYHISQNRVIFYKNGIIDGISSANNTPNLSNEAFMYIGRDDPSNSANYFFSGSLDNLRIYERSLSDSEISKLYKEN